VGTDTLGPFSYHQLPCRAWVPHAKPLPEIHGIVRYKGVGSSLVSRRSLMPDGIVLPGWFTGGGLRKLPKLLSGLPESPNLIPKSMKQIEKACRMVVSTNSNPHYLTCFRGFPPT